jgi:hypothetical protein
MKAQRLALVVLLGALLAAGSTSAQAPSETQGQATAPTPEDEDGWSFSASLFGYFVPEDTDYGQPTFMADRDWLHLEGRVNYEDLGTGSLWLGYNLSFGSTVAFELTPMLGVVVGDTDGVAPGYRAAVSWRRLDFSSESEYVFDAGDSSDNFFYTWSELGWSPAEWVRLGFVVQRTKAYQTDLDVQRGFLVGFAYRNASLTTYVFNPDRSPTVVVGLTLDF